MKLTDKQKQLAESNQIIPFVMDKLAEMDDRVSAVEEMPNTPAKMVETIVNNTLKDVRGEKGDTGERGEKGEKGDKGEPGKDGKNGKDGRDGRDGRDGLDGQDGKDGKDGKDGEMGEIDEATIAYLEDKIEQTKREIANVRQSRAGWGAHPLVVKDGVTTIDKVTRVINFGNNLSASRSADGVVTVNAAASGGISVETPTGAVDGSNAAFTVSDVPQWVVADGITYFDGAGYTYAALSITMDVAPSQYIRAII